MSRRENGLHAQAYTPLVEVAPQLADAVLEALREAGIAAYATPATGEVGGYLDVHLPDEPTDRVYVDASARTRAEEVLRRDLPRLRAEYERASEADDDRAWQEIVSRFDAPPSSTPPWPEREDLGDDAGPALVRIVRPAARRGEPEAEEDDDHFVPPTPPPLPQSDAVTKGAWVALFGGPAYLLLAATLDWEVPGWAAFVAVGAFVGGFVTLVVRMGDGPSRGSGPDDGAVV